MKIHAASLVGSKSGIDEGLLPGELRTLDIWLGKQVAGCLKHNSPLVKKDGVSIALGKSVLATPDEIIELVGLLDSNDHHIRYYAEVSLLGKGIDPEARMKAVSFLEEVVKNKGNSENTRCVAVEVLGKIRAKEALPVLKKVVTSDKNEHVVAVGIEALGRIGEEAVPLLKELLNHPDEFIQVNSARALGSVGSEHASSMSTFKLL